MLRCALCKRIDPFAKRFRRREGRPAGRGEGVERLEDVPQGQAPGSQSQAEALGGPERLETEARTLRAQNESLEERLRGIESSVTWRLLGPYRRPRSVGDDPTEPASDDGTRDDDTAGSR